MTDRRMKNRNMRNMKNRKMKIKEKEAGDMEKDPGKRNRNGNKNEDGNEDRNRSKRLARKMKQVLALYAVLVLVMLPGTVTVCASDPIAVVNNLSNFIFGLIRAIGMILLGFGIVQVGLSLKSHDPSQRANGFLTLAGGIIITFAKEILTMITG